MVKHANVRWLRMCGCGLAVLAAGLLLVASLALPVQASGLAQEGKGDETPTVIATPVAPQPAVQGPYVGQPVLPVVLDADLRQLPQAELRHENIQRPWRRLHPPESRPEDKADEAPPDALAQTQMPLAAMPSPLENFDGLSLTSDCGGVLCGSGWPPDPNGDVGPVYYVQAVNTAFGIFNKATGARLTALTFDTLFFGTGTACDDSNFGDPIVLYDAMADRWLLSDFAWDTTDTDTGPYYECIAVSKTGDPVIGGWYLYALRADDDAHPWLADYPKLGVWPDGYYMSANMFDCVSDCGPSSKFEGVRVWALNRTALINGQALQEVHFDIPSLVYDEVMLPANLRGALPPGGTPNFFVAMDDNFTFGGNDVLHLWKFRVNWATPANSTFTGPTDLIVSPFTLPSSGTGVPQPGTSAELDTLGDRLMMQLQYRNINGIESLWVNHTVASGGVTGIRWYELRNPNGTPVVYQQGTYQPDSTYRWMGSLAVDNDGNMALGFSASSSSIYPAIRYVGRLVTDTLGTLGQGETTLIAGTGAQTGSSTGGRWGDYSAMTIDPVDDCTFWYTNEYYAASGSTWKTRIGAFRFPTCSNVSEGILTGTVSRAANGQPLAGALVRASILTTTISTVTNANGVYVMSLTSGTYTVTAAQYGYLPATISGVSITAGLTTTRNFSLSVAPSYVISGIVTDSVYGLPLRATLTITGDPFNPPTTTLQTDPATGYYSLTLAGGQAYTLTASALLHASAARNLGVLSGNQTQNFALTAITTTGGLIGYVRDYTNSLPIRNALVAVAAAGDPNATTDAQGYFQILGLAPGLYTATASAGLYSSAAISNIQVLTGNVTSVSFLLPTSTFSYAPSDLQKTVAFRATVADSPGIVITNTGLGELTYELVETTRGTGTALNRYSLLTPTSPYGPAFNWIDATSGTALNLTDDDEASLTLPFPFPFYTATSPLLRVGNNGAVMFGTNIGHIGYANTAITETSTPNFFIAPFWDDIGDEAGNVYWTVLGSAPNRRVVIEWYDRPHYQGGGDVGSATFEIVLFEDGDILYQYQDVDFGNAAYDNGASATVGLRGPNASNSLQYSFKTPSLQNNFALCFDRLASPRVCGNSVDALPWLSETFVTGQASGGVTTTVGVSLTWDTTAPQVQWAGDYSGTLWIFTNDPKLPSAALPVTMTVPVTYGVSAPLALTSYSDPGGTVSQTITLTNMGNVTDTFTVTVGNHVFTTTAPASVGPLAAGASAPLVVVVIIPPGTPLDVSDTVTITFASQGDPNRSASTMLTTVAGYRRLYLPLIVR